MKLPNSKVFAHSRSRTFFLILTGLLIVSGCVGSNLPQFSMFRKKAESNQANWKNTVAESQANHLNWSTSYTDALQAATREGKLLMAHFTGSDWCAWCIKLEDEVFDTPNFQAWADQNVIPLKLDFPKMTKLSRELTAQNNQVKQKYDAYIKGYPTVLFIDSSGSVVAKMGYASGGPEAWISQAESKMQ